MQSKPKAYQVRPCVIVGDFIEQAAADEVPDFWSVYERDDEGLYHQISDHDAKESAEAEAAYLENRGPELPPCESSDKAQTEMGEL